MNSTPAVSVVVPAFNEAASVGQTIQELKDALQPNADWQWEIIVVDDGSTDDTANVAETAGARVIRHPQNTGYGRALKTGIEGSCHDVIAIIDADGTYPAKELPTLIALYGKGFDMVVGARTGPHYRQSWIKWPLRLLLRGIVEWVSGRRIPDINSGFRIFNRNVYALFSRHLCDTFSFTTSLTLAMILNSHSVKYHPIDYAPRVGSSKVRLVGDSWRTSKVIMEAMLFHSPMTIFFVLSAVCVIASAISVAIGITFQMATGFMMGVGSLLAAIIVFSLGLLTTLLKEILKK